MTNDPVMVWGTGPGCTRFCEVCKMIVTGEYKRIAGTERYYHPGCCERTNDFPIQDPIHHPPHYTRGKIECIDFIEDQGLGYHLGQVIKYVCRAGFKSKDTEVEDLKKARWCLDRLISKKEKP